MLRIEYFDKNRFMKQVAASRGSVILHLDNGSTCALKKANEASAIFQTLDAPKKGFRRYSEAVFHPRTTVARGVLREECEELMSGFFAGLRG